MEYGHSERTYSQETANAIDDEIRRLISSAHERARKLLTENRSILDNMSRVLVEKETIYTEEVAMLMKGASYKEVIETMESREGVRRENPFKTVSEPSPEHIVKEETDETQATAETETTEEKKD